MYDGVSEREKSFIRDFIFKEVEVIEGYDSCILHCSPFVFVSEDLIVFREGVSIAKILLEKVHRFYSHLLYVGR